MRLISEEYLDIVIDLKKRIQKTLQIKQDGWDFKGTTGLVQARKKKNDEAIIYWTSILEDISRILEEGFNAIRSALSEKDDWTEYCKDAAELEYGIYGEEYSIWTDFRDSPKKSKK